MEAVVGGRSVGVPGTMKLLETAHKSWGKLPWPRLFEPAIRLADEGFAISPRLGGLLAQEKALKNDPVARAYFYQEDGSPKPVGSILKNPAFAETLRVLAAGGADAFYEGRIAEDIVATVKGHPTNPGEISPYDLQVYSVIEKPAVCGPYRVFQVCGMGPPSSGAIAIQQILSVLETRDIARMKPGPEAVHWFAEAGRLAFADRALYLGDPFFANVPVKGLVDPDYLKSRAALVSPDKSMGKAQAGDPPFQKTERPLPADGIEHGTSHISVDRRARQRRRHDDDDRGWLRRPPDDEERLPPQQRAHRLQLRCRPRTASRSQTASRRSSGRAARCRRPSSSTPSDGFTLVTGSPGGSQIIGYVAKTLVAILDWKLDPQTAVDLPNFGSRNGPTELEAGTEAEGWKAALEAKGHEVRLMDMTSGIQAIVVTPEGFAGGADSRREGVAIGD